RGGQSDADPRRGDAETDRSSSFANAMITQQQSFSELHHLARIARLLARPENQRGPEWLELALQSAVSVEFSTIPPYLSALWSIKDQMHPVAASIRDVVQEEMLHMALACNMLTALGCVSMLQASA